MQESIGRLEGISVKLRQEKADLVHEISEIKQEAHQEIIKVEGRLKARIRGLEAEISEKTQRLEELEQRHQVLHDNYDDATVTIKQHESQILQVCLSCSNDFGPLLKNYTSRHGFLTREVSM